MSKGCVAFFDRALRPATIRGPTRRTREPDRVICANLCLQPIGLPSQGERVSNSAILFFAHGSRDTNWRRPFDAILADFRGMHATKLAELAFLEFMQPDFAASVNSLVEQGAAQIRVIPLFLAEGAHTRRDLAALIETAQTTHPAVLFTVSPAIGEVDSIRSAISSWVATQL